MAVSLHHVVIDAHDLPAMARFWAQVLGWRILSEREREIVIGDDATAPVGICFMPVTDAKTTKNRLHLDLSPDPGEQEAEIERILALGARRVAIGQTGAESWTVLADPEGNEFAWCVRSGPSSAGGASSDGTPVTTLIYPQPGSASPCLPSPRATACQRSLHQLACALVVTLDREPPALRSPLIVRGQQCTGWQQSRMVEGSQDDDPEAFVATVDHTGGRARKLPETPPHVSSPRPTTQPSTALLTRAAVLGPEVPHGGANPPSIDGKDGVASSILAEGSTPLVLL
jgi:predicted enzyme related to lactoylglutathione lyase